MSHDQNFKNLILDYPRETIQFAAAAEATSIDPTARIIPLRQEQLEERLGDRFRELDVPLLVEWPDGRRAALLFLIEEETHPNRFSIHRLAHYCLDIAELLNTERIVPVVIFLHPGHYPTTLGLGGDANTYLHFHYLPCPLFKLSARDYFNSHNIVARLNLPNMAYPPEDKIHVYAHSVRGLLELEPNPERQIKYLDFIDIYANLDDNDRHLYHQHYPKEANSMSQFAERFINQGIQQGVQQGLQQGIQQGLQQGIEQGIQHGIQRGIQQGIQQGVQQGIEMGIQKGIHQGVQQGEARMLLALLNTRFGPLPPTVKARIDAADAETLLLWSERILTAQSLNEVLR